MGLIRLLTIALLVWLAWFMIRNYLNKQSTPKQNRKLQAGRVVKCHYCEVHLPEQEALQHDANWFCSTEHMRAWLGGPGKS